MNLLLDTHYLIWSAMGSSRLGEEAGALVSDERNVLHFSVVSIWEVAIKSSLRRTDPPVDPGAFRRALVDAGFVEVPVTGQHAVEVASLPDLHRDPFDRLLLAQARCERLLLVTADRAISRYAGPVRYLAPG